MGMPLEIKGAKEVTTLKKIKWQTLHKMKKENIAIMQKNVPLQ